MNRFESPFFAEIKQCRQIMRKLRKKIYKHSISTKNTSKKPRDNTQEIIDIFKHRNIPAFVIDTLKKRRNFDLASIKNIAISIQIPLREVQHRTNLQEEEISNLYIDHKERMQEIKNQIAVAKAERNDSLKLHPVGMYSSTEEQLFSCEQEKYQQSVEYLHNSEEHYPQKFEGHMFTQNYLHMNMESSLNSDLAFFNF